MCIWLHHRSLSPFLSLLNRFQLYCSPSMGKLEDGGQKPTCSGLFCCGRPHWLLRALRGGRNMWWKLPQDLSPSRGSNHRCGGGVSLSRWGGAAGLHLHRKQSLRLSRWAEWWQHHGPTDLPVLQERTRQAASHWPWVSHFCLPLPITMSSKLQEPIVMGIL